MGDLPAWLAASHRRAIGRNPERDAYLRNPTSRPYVRPPPTRQDLVPLPQVPQRAPYPLPRDAQPLPQRPIVVQPHLNLRQSPSPNLPLMAGERTAPSMPFVPETSIESPAQRAALATGMPREYIEALTGHESGGNADAQASTSSALGHGQFIKSTWRSLMQNEGDRYGLPENMSEAELQDLRRDPQWSALMIGEYGRQNADVLRQQIGRDPTEGETYLAHFLNPVIAARVVRAAAQDRRHGTHTPIESIVDRAAIQANHNVFYEGGRLRTPQQVLDRQTRNFRNERIARRPRGVD